MNTRAKRLRNENANGNQASNELKTLNNASNTFVQTLIAENSIISYIGRLIMIIKANIYVSGAIRQ